MIAEFGWSRGQTSMGYGALSFAAAVLGILWGVVSDRWGSRWLIVMAALAMPAALFMLSRTEALWQFYLAYVVFGGLGFAALFGPIMATVGFWFKKNTGLAIGLVAAGGAAGQGLIPFLADMLITDHGWQEAYSTLAVVYLVFGLPLALLIREAPARLAARKNAGTAGAAGVNDGHYLMPPRAVMTWLSVAVIFCCICMSLPIVHVVPLVTDRGLSPEIGASVLMTLMLAGILGRIFGGVLGGIIGALPTYIIFSISQTTLAFLFPHVPGLTGLYLLAILFGIAYSGVMVIITYCLRVMIPPRIAGSALGVVGFFGMFGMGLGAYLGGVLFDLTGDYVWSFATASMAGVINLCILAMFHGRRKQIVSRLAPAPA